MNNLRRKYKRKVVSVVTEKESKMDKLHQLLLKERNGLIIYECAAHWMNILAQDIILIYITKYVVEVQRCFRNHQPATELEKL